MTRTAQTTAETTASERTERRRRRRLREEFTDAGLELPHGLGSADRFIAELDYARYPPVHEGTLPTYGAVIVDGPIDPTTLNANVATLHPDDDQVVRLLADGRHSFMLHGPDHVALLLLDVAHDREAALVNLHEELRQHSAVIVQRRPNGLVRVLDDRHLSIWDGAHWWTKPYATDFAQAVLDAHPDAPSVILDAILDFCVHTMSPADAGTTLVWAHRAEHLREVAGLSASRPPTLVPTLSFASRGSRSAVRQLLSQVDGAAILNAHGNLIAIGAQLRSSVASHETLRLDPALGTRHASARRYSHDHHDTVIFVVSRDGPVTVYAHGDEVTCIRTKPDPTH